MKTIIALLLSSSAAFAADLSVKAPIAPKTPACATATDCSGFFVGVNFGNEGGVLTVFGANFGQSTTPVGLDVGYQHWDGKWYWRAMGYTDYDVSVNALGGLTDKFSWGACGSLGYSLADAFGMVATGQSGTAQAPAIPANLLQSLLTPYASVCTARRHSQQAAGYGLGFEALLAPRWTMTVDALNWNYGNGSAGNIAGVQVARASEQEVKGGIHYHFSPH